jgi:hypothetical protein
MRSRVDHSHKHTASALGPEPPEAEASQPGERRRRSRVKHDDRGNAYVEWLEAPAEIVERPKFEIQDHLELEERATGGAYDPYANPSGASRRTGNTTRTDLRKLSEWIKLMRELEERKRNGGEGEEGD